MSQNVKPGSCRENPNLKFVQLRAVKVGDAVTNDVRNGIAVSESYKLVFVVSDQRTVTALSESDIFNYEWSKSVINQTATVRPFADYTCHMNVNFLSVSPTGRVLLASGTSNTTTDLLFWDVKQIAETRNATPFTCLSVGPAKRLVCLDWHPEFADSLLIACFSDGSVSTIAVNVNEQTAAKLTDYVVNPAVTSVSWSPKGKQVLMAKANGCITFYKHRNGTGFQEARNIAPPDHLKSFAISNVKWILSTIILASYCDPNSSDDPDTKYMLITAPAKAMPEYFEYGRLVMDSAEYIPNGSYATAFHLIGNMVLSTTSHSSEVAVIGCENTSDGGNGLAWEQFSLEDNARIELPINGADETFCRGVWYTMQTTKSFRLSEAETIGGQTTPAVFILTSAGLICPYYMVHREDRITPLTQALTVMQLEFSGTRNPVPASAPVAQKAHSQSPNDLSFCPPSHSTPTPKTNAFALKQATFGAGKPLSQPITQTPVGKTVPSVFGSGGSTGSTGYTATPVVTSSPFSFDEAADALTNSNPVQPAQQPANVNKDDVPASDRDIPLEEAEKEMRAISEQISRHKTRVMQFMSRRAEETNSPHFEQTVQRLSNDMKQIESAINTNKLEIKSLKGWIAQDFDSLTMAEKQANKLKNADFSDFQLDPLTAKSFSDVKNRSDKLARQLETISQMLANEWSAFIESKEAAKTKQTDILKKSIADCNSAITALNAEVSAIKRRVN